MGLSVNKFTYTGEKEFDLNFALGYASRTDIECFIDGEFPIDVQFDWLTDNRVRISGPYPELGDTLVFTRTVSKVDLPVDLKQPSNLTRENVETALKHSLYAMHEVLDSRISANLQVSDAVYQSINEAVQTALDNFIFATQFNHDILLKPSLEGFENTVYTSGGYFVDTSSALIFVDQPPSSNIEVLIGNNSQVILAFTVSTTGEVQFTTTSTQTLTAGPLYTSVVGGNYTSGCKLTIVMPVVHSGVIDFNKTFTDYVNVLETARNT